MLSDILGDEDHLGDMDFKVAGTAEGVSALQMDIKIDGITEEIMKRGAGAGQARSPAHPRRNGQGHLPTPRGEMSEYAPRLLTIKIHPDKIREVIGKGGATIRSITEETGTTIDISDDGTVIDRARSTARLPTRPRSASSRSSPTSSRVASTRARSPS